MQRDQAPRQKHPYTAPRLERHAYTVVTGASFPVGTTGLSNPFSRELFNSNGDR